MTVVVALAAVSAIALRCALRASTRAAVTRRLPRSTRLPSLAPVAERWGDRLLRSRRDRIVERALPEALDAVARSLRSGASLRHALDEAVDAVRGPLRDDLVVVRREIRDGCALDDALARWCERRPLPGVRLATAALALGAETGGASAQAIDGVTATLRTNLGIAGEVRALSSQARLSALVIVLAPIAFSLLAATSDGTTAAFLLGTPVGWLCLAVGLGLDAIGWWWMRRITEVVA